MLTAANKKLARALSGRFDRRASLFTRSSAARDTFTSDAAERAGRQALDTLDNIRAERARRWPRSSDFQPVFRDSRRPCESGSSASSKREPIEDYRLDFEDGYGTRPDAEEDGHAASAAREVAAGMTAGTLPPFIGIRIKPLSKELHARSLRTLDIFVTTLVKTARRLPAELCRHRHRK